ncbi:hypothetical protein VNO78_16094 [Psophocarpus tetragonolobus]|uniref:Uncharacterized protein n=1 Tax=Psophocarpus tetragonolobus TaxID=3891 RepID=A0AAN9XKH0_PSOTE
MKEQVLGRGLPVQFISRLKIATLSEGDLLTVRFPLVPWCAPTPSQWTVLRGSNEVKLSGYNNTVSGRFKVVKGTFQNSYTLSFCPLVGICRRVGGPYFGGSGNLVVGAKANVMQFRFQKLTGHLGDEVPVLAMKNYVSEE